VNTQENSIISKWMKLLNMILQIIKLDDATLTVVVKSLTTVSSRGTPKVRLMQSRPSSD
jgi:hypothetical protein